ncbi:MAG: type III pantothenate kinase [Halioglobus sp.]
MSSSEPSLQLDVGNSGAKWRVVLAGQIVARGTFVWGDVGSSERLLESTQSVDEILVASVASPEKDLELAALLENRWGVIPWFAKTPIQTKTQNGILRNSYADPSRMGVDRWLAMLAAQALFTGAFCVVDAGSALTIDHVSETGQHLGGYIIPGPALMERALLLDTDRVRFDESANYALTPGDSTAEAVRHGIALAQVGAVELALKRTQKAQDIVFSGGAGKVLLDLGQVAGTYRQDLVFEGLEIIARSTAM